jgi:predicted transcriptional regulator with HTH domain
MPGDDPRTTRLTAPQIATLRDAARECGVSAVDSYKPPQRLLSLGLVTRTERRFGQAIYRITDAGRAVLKEHP